MNSFAVFLLALLPFCLGAPATNDIVLKFCKSSDADLKTCWLNMGTQVATHVINGVPSHNIPPISPLYVPRHEIKTPTYSAVFTNLKYDGVSTYIILDVLPDALDNSAVFKVLIKDLKLESDVTVKGNFAGVPLDGSGKIKIDFVNITYDATLKWETFTVDGVKYHNVFGDITNVHYGIVELKAFDLIKDADKLETLKQKLHELKTANYLSVLEDTFIKYIINYSLRAYNTFAVAD